MPATTLLGQERDVEAARQRLGRANVRVLTLAGPRGVGKTRLALRPAADFGERHSLRLARRSVARRPNDWSCRWHRRRPVVHSADCARPAAPSALLLIPDNVEHLLLTAPEVEQDNLWAALGWVIPATETAGLRLGLRPSAALGRFWLKRGYLGEGRNWLERTLAAAPSGRRGSKTWGAS